MTPAEHYEEAERLLGEDAADPDQAKDISDWLLHRAKVHALLALAPAPAHTPALTPVVTVYKNGEPV